jgi:hypothetical protein
MRLRPRRPASYASYVVAVALVVLAVGVGASLAGIFILGTPGANAQIGSGLLVGGVIGIVVALGALLWLSPLQPVARQWLRRIRGR